MFVDSSGDSSVDSTGREGNKRHKLEEEEDRISSLPDPIIHHILSLLPSTKQAIQTGVLSKQWRKQWTHVPVLIFDISGSGMSSENFCRYIDNTLILHNCPKIKKFHVVYDYSPRTYSEFTTQIRFAITRYVEELILNLNGSAEKYRLPKLLFDHSSLVKLDTANCTFAPNGKVNWGFLKVLKLSCCLLIDDAIENVLSGSPSIESLELSECYRFDDGLVIHSKSLKTLVLKFMRGVPRIEILCPILIRAKLDIGARWNICDENYKYHTKFTKEILEQLQNVKELILGSLFIKSLSDLPEGAVSSLSSPLLNCKRLNIYSVNFQHPAVISCALRNSPVLENLVISVLPLILQNEVTPHPSDLNDSLENYWNSNEAAFNCLVSHLKTVKIIGLSRSDCKYKLVLNFVEFLLKNARVLEKMVVVLEDSGADFPIKVSNELLSVPKCSGHTIVELCSR